MFAIIFKRRGCRDGTEQAARACRERRSNPLEPQRQRDWMRTISSTVSTMEEAEAVSRRLQEMGVSSDNISLKPLGGSESAPSEAVFISAKVTPDQVNPATEILNGPPRTSAIDPSAESEGISSELPVRGVSEKAVWPPPVAPKPAIQRGPRAADESAAAPARKASPVRLLAIFGLIVAAGIVLGFLLGSVT